MSEEYRNIYQNARKSAGITQEAAAERLGISPKSIQIYETGGRVPPNDVVERMAICYNTQYLAFQHLHETNTLAARIIPALEPRSLREVAVRFYNRMTRLAKGRQMEQLLIMAEDDLIDDEEQAEFDAMVSELMETACICMELGLFRQPESKE